MPWGRRVMSHDVDSEIYVRIRLEPRVHMICSCAHARSRHKQVDVAIAWFLSSLWTRILESR